MQGARAWCEIPGRLGVESHALARFWNKRAFHKEGILFVTSAQLMAEPAGKKAKTMDVRLGYWNIRGVSPN